MIDHLVFAIDVAIGIAFASTCTITGAIVGASQDKFAIAHAQDLTLSVAHTTAFAQDLILLMKNSRCWCVLLNVMYIGWNR